MKKILALLLTTTILLSAVSCQDSEEKPSQDQPGNQVSTYVWDDEFNYLALENYTGNTGVPLGGTGVGYFEYAPDGTFQRVCVNNIQADFINDVNGMFLSVWDSSSNSAHRLQRDNKIYYGMEGYENSTYTGLWPQAEVSFNGAKGAESAVEVSVKAYSGVVAQDIKNSSLPVVYFEVTMKNTKNEAIQASAALSWGDVIGRGIRDTNKYQNANFDVNGESSSWQFMDLPKTRAENYEINGWTGVRQYAIDKADLNPEKWTLQNYNSEFTILAQQQEGAEITALKAYKASEKDSGDAWSGFTQSGIFTEEVGTANLSNDNSAQKIVNASAVAAKVSLAANETKTVRFMVSWFMEEPDQNEIFSGRKGSYFEGCNYGKYYHNYFSDITALNEYASGNYTYVAEKIQEWQQPILDSNLPDYLKFKQINSGYTLYTNGVLNKKGNFSTLEGAMGGLGGTMDQKMSSHPFYQKLFTELNTNENNQFANNTGSSGEILHFDMHYYDGICDFDENNKEQPTVGGSMIDNTGSWIFQILKDYEQTGDISYIQDHYETLKKAMKKMKYASSKTNPIPSYATTYDDATHPDIFIYTGTVYLAMLEASARIADILGDTAQATEYRTIQQDVANYVDKLYVTTNGEGYYCIGSNKAMDHLETDIIFSGQLAGQFMSRYCGWGDVVPFDKAVSSMKKLLTTSVQEANDYFAPKIYNFVSKQSLDNSGSRTWPFYLDSYTAMAAIQMGYVEDGLKIMEHTQLVQMRNGYMWSQNLWNPGNITYMTAPVNWFVNDVLAGAAISVPEKTITLGPCTIPGTDELVTPLYYPEFWAMFKYNAKNKTASLEIIKTFTDDDIVFETLKVQPNGKSEDACETVKLSSPFTVKEGAVLDLSAYAEKFANSNRIDSVLQPVEKYQGVAEEVIANGNGLKGIYYNDADFDNAITTRTDETIDFNWETKPLDEITANQYSVRWSGELLPRYGQEYKVTLVYTGSIKVICNGEVVIDALDNEKTELTEVSFNMRFEAGKKYPIKISYISPASGNAQITLKWWSTTQTEEIINKYRLYS